MNRRKFITASSTVALVASVGGRSQNHSPKIRIGQIGTMHSHAKGKVRAIRSQSDTYELVGVVAENSKRQEALSQTNAYEGVRWMSEAELLAVPGLQAVAIEAEVSQLVHTAQRCIDAGLHIHFDKPGGDSMSEYRRLIRSAEASQRIVQMGYMLRYNRAFQFMYQAVRDGWLGNIMEIDCMMGKLGDESVREAIGTFSGGGMFELGGHVIDSIIHMLGMPHSVTPFGHQTQGDGVADNQLAVLDFDQAIATVRINHRDPFGFPRRRFQISGDKGTIEIQQLESGEVRIYLDEARGGYAKGEQRISLGKDGRYEGEFRDLAKAIRGEKAFEWSYQHDLDTHETLLRASGMPVG